MPTTLPNVGDLVEITSAVDGATYCGRIERRYETDPRVADPLFSVKVVGFVPTGRAHALGDLVPRKASEIRQADQGGAR